MRNVAAKFVYFCCDCSWKVKHLQVSSDLNDQGNPWMVVFFFGMKYYPVMQELFHKPL